jgi:hypothetical protein
MDNQGRGWSDLFGKLANLEGRATRDFLDGNYRQPRAGDGGLPDPTRHTERAIHSSARLVAFDLLNAATPTVPRAEGRRPGRRGGLAAGSRRRRGVGKTLPGDRDHPRHRGRRCPCTHRQRGHLVNPAPGSPEQKLRPALSGYLMWVHNCREGNSCDPDHSELVSEATSQWMAAIDRWGVSGPHMAE